ncbi:core-binding factor subunit beta isoform X1 [Patella vulgata]|uniref:core-binding factor subunit beta isoform X1 n=1 Tax=Patella vulgata TaxID=6465 RepID=UPI0021805C42|nr:core-binding factor subunit beta isoform X1 [Patella vulgata]
MNEVSGGNMLSFVASTLCCEVRENNYTTMPRVVPDQRAKFDNDELFRKLSRECEVRYTGFRDRPHDERQLRFQTECREGHADIAFIATGTNLQLSFSSNAWSDKPEDRIPTREFVDFEREPSKVHLKSQFIMNGVCVMWRGWIDLNRLDGIGSLEYDAERAEVEQTLLREQIEQYNRRLREFEERQRQYRQDQDRQAESEAEVKKANVRPMSQKDDFYPTHTDRPFVHKKFSATAYLEKAVSNNEVRMRVPVKPATVNNSIVLQNLQKNLYIL